MQQIVNRAAISVTPKEPFIDWVHSYDEGSARIAAEEIRESPHIYLVRDSDYGDDPAKLIRKNFKVIFEEELNGWIIDESTWPAKRDLKTFKAWFEVKIHEIVFDMDDSPHVVEEA